ncbi:MAG: hypothetical protein GKR94_24270 [Gammaproteobacteria bacterium]|nr:hypothetical protein [Gammaproteobacteria bacterium]
MGGGPEALETALTVDPVVPGLGRQPPDYTVTPRANPNLFEAFNWHLGRQTDATSIW